MDEQQQSEDYRRGFADAKAALVGIKARCDAERARLLCGLAADQLAIVADQRGRLEDGTHATAREVAAYALSFLEDLARADAKHGLSLSATDTLAAA